MAKGRHGPYNHLRMRPYCASMPGYDPCVVYAVSRGQALADVWRSDAFSGLTFKQVLKQACVRLAPRAPDPRFGDPITVDGEQAYFAYSTRASVHYARPGGMYLRCAHPYEVEPECYRPQQYRERVRPHDLH